MQADPIKASNNGAIVATQLTAAVAAADIVANPGLVSPEPFKVAGRHAINAAHLRGLTLIPYDDEAYHLMWRSVGFKLEAAFKDGPEAFAALAEHVGRWAMSPTKENLQKALDH